MSRLRYLALGAGLVVLVSVLLVLVRWYPNRANPYWGRKVYASMAGTGDPWPYLTAKRVLLLRALHDGYSLERQEDILRLPRDRILSELRVLEDAGLVTPDHGLYRPAFLVADRDEAERTYAHARVTGRFIAEELLSRWTELAASFSTLRLSQSRSFAEMAFLLVGGRILDIGMLEALAEDETLLTPAPQRPTPGRTNSRYYLWMVEGDLKYLGRYGQDEIDLARGNWYLLTFAQNVVSRKPNPTRETLAHKYQDLVEASPDSAPEFFARQLNVGLMSQEDAAAWQMVTHRIAADLVAALKRSGPDIPRFYRSLRAGEHGEGTLGEFFVWYYHLAYAWAIDELAERGVLTIPRGRCSAVILYRDGGEGVLKGL